MAKDSPRGRKSLAADKAATGVAAGHVTNTAHRAPELERLEVFISRWITEGETTASTEAPSMQIVASDVYQWAPGGHFVIHPAYGCIGEVGVGGLEVIGFDSATGRYRTHFFDSRGNIITETLSYQDGVWTWQGTDNTLYRCSYRRWKGADGAPRALGRRNPLGALNVR
jgi:hypothetical protein